MDIIKEYMDEVRARVSAIPGPLRAEDSNNSWNLYAQPFPEAHGSKILKAAKHGTPYAEYWPNEIEEQFLVNSWSDLTLLLAMLDKALEGLDHYWHSQSFERAEGTINAIEALIPIGRAT